MFTVHSNAYFGAETQTEAAGVFSDVALSTATALFSRGHLRDVWITNANDKVVWWNGREIVVPKPAKLSGADLFVALTEAVKNERRAADVAGYYMGERGPAEAYEQAQARTNSLINQLLMN